MSISRAKGLNKYLYLKMFILHKAFIKMKSLFKKCYVNDDFSKAKGVSWQKKAEKCYFLYCEDLARVCLQNLTLSHNTILILCIPYAYFPNLK